MPSEGSRARCMLQILDSEGSWQLSEPRGQPASTEIGNERQPCHRRDWRAPLSPPICVEPNFRYCAQSYTTLLAPRTPTELRGPYRPDVPRSYGCGGTGPAPELSQNRVFEFRPACLELPPLCRSRRSSRCADQHWRTTSYIDESRSSNGPENSPTPWKRSRGMKELRTQLGYTSFVCPATAT